MARRYEIEQNDEGQWFWDSPLDGVQGHDTFPSRAEARKDAVAWYKEASEHGF